MWFCYSDSGWKLVSIGFSFDKITKATKIDHIEIKRLEIPEIQVSYMVFKLIQNPEETRHNCQRYSYTEVRAHQLHAMMQLIREKIYVTSWKQQKV